MNVQHASNFAETSNFDETSNVVVGSVKLPIEYDADFAKSLKKLNEELKETFDDQVPLVIFSFDRIHHFL